VRAPLFGNRRHKGGGAEGDYHHPLVLHDGRLERDEGIAQ